MLLGEQKSNFVEKKKEQQNDKNLFKSNLCTRITQKQKNFMYKLQKEIDP